MSRTIRKILKSDLCAGCGLCESIAPEGVSVELDAKGYYRPQLEKDLTRKEDFFLRKACPALTVQHSPEVVEPDPIWGPVCYACTGYSGDKDIRYKGSSGGVLTTLQIKLLREHKVDAVINVGASDREPLLNEVYLCRHIDEITANSGSRYAPSAPLRQIHKMTRQLKRFAFVGKPCDVSALRRLAAHDPDLRDKKILYLSFLCAGVPSQQATHSLVKRLGLSPEEVVKFRYRGEGWPGFTKAQARDGRIARMSYAESWGENLNRSLQTRCKVCPDGSGEFADIACGDAWHGDERGYPDFSEMPGRSVILARTKEGEALLKDAVETKDIVLEQETYSLDDLSRVQPYQVNRRNMILPRTLAFSLVRLRFVHFNLRSAIEAGKGISLKRKIREFSGTIKRLISRTRP